MQLIATTAAYSPRRGKEAWIALFTQHSHMRKIPFNNSNSNRLITQLIPLNQLGYRRNVVKAHKRQMSERKAKPTRAAECRSVTNGRA
jgi:hypothetical protein